jgi:hypothetical protein
VPWFLVLINKAKSRTYCGYPQFLLLVAVLAGFIKLAELLDMTKHSDQNPPLRELIFGLVSVTQVEFMKIIFATTWIFIARKFSSFLFGDFL